MINGIINIYKEKGYTSHDVVAKARGILKTRKIGHTGTLDPEAEGVLPICIGSATKAVSYLTDADKCYEAEVRLGAITTTEDATGEVIEEYKVNVSKEQIENALASFVGSYTQIPPMYSAIKVNGVRLYELARKGIVIDRPSREVWIESCDLIEIVSNKCFKIRVNCSKGTYIRTLCTDIGKLLGCGAHMGHLLRTRVGHFELGQSITLAQLEAHKDNLTPFIEDLETIFKSLPKVSVNEKGNLYLNNGNPLKKIHLLQNLAPYTEGDIVAVYNTSGQFTALYKWSSEKDYFKVEKMFKEGPI